ncbi:murein hydrolase activator EnvC family protein [Sutcliffiella cohnii]|uniref:murein hydrolase activator EnvC family protein n=1 Tax=Sutcliffiella cohnii TaxID=33932 RepID=UPI002E1FA32F|nr:peptidoglycan DD-metalloendopeptidase family protein [Sutcliffiella cohnii]
MRRKIGIGIIAAVIGLSVVFSTNYSDTTFANGLQEKLNENKEAQSNLESSLNEKQEEVNKLQAEQAQTEAEITRLDKAVEETKAKIRTKKDEIETTRQDIEQLKKEIEALMERIERRTALLEDRARTFQTGGGAINYIDVVLGAQSFSDFIDRVNAVALILQADRDIVQAHEDDLKLLEDKELELRSKLSNLETQLTELEGLEKSLEGQIAEKAKIMDKLKKQEQEAMHEIHEIEDEAAFLRAQERAIQSQIKAEEERKKREEEERKRREAEQAKKASSNSNSNSNSNNGGSSSGNNSTGTAPAPAVTSGNFMRPATGRVTSEFGPRWGTFHYGIDIGKNGRTEDVPVVAAAAGTVFRSSYTPSYGNAVFITHNIDGQIWTTVYAHLENRAVGEGQYVEKGQYLGMMGNTGDSTGPHLHFELHKGPYQFPRVNAVNPRNYINF